ncbi:TPA: hypothetical protein DDW35_11525 [Candidatus Sumerlaeota bacterium]|jgi:hypothetical protein|nr:hypothetical protein [Candidatus Sumerlaeota bacterium]
MKNWKEIRAAIETHLVEQWVDADGNLRTPIQWENVVFDPDSENDVSALTANKESFIRVTMIEDGVFKRELGDMPECSEYAGSMVIQVFTSAGIGPGEIAGMMSDVDAMLRAKVLDEDVYFEPHYRVVGKINVGAWFLVTMEFPFTHAQ